jgi:hypothetical protein
MDRIWPSCPQPPRGCGRKRAGMRPVVHSNSPPVDTEDNEPSRRRTAATAYPLGSHRSHQQPDAAGSVRAGSRTAADVAFSNHSHAAAQRTTSPPVAVPAPAWSATRCLSRTQSTGSASAIRRQFAGQVMDHAHPPGPTPPPTPPTDSPHTQRIPGGRHCPSSKDLPPRRSTPWPIGSANWSMLPWHAPVLDPAEPTVSTKHLRRVRTVVLSRP